MLGTGNESSTVTSFSQWKSTQNRVFPPSFLTNTKGLAGRLWVGLITLLSSPSSSKRSTS